MSETSESEQLMGSGESAAVEGVESPEAAKKRLEELKQARNQVIDGITQSVSGPAETQVLTTEGEIPGDQLANQAVKSSEGKKEVSALTIGRMMGLVTLPEFKLMENKLDLLSTRMNSILVKMDKIASILESAPTGADLDRIDVQIGSMRTLVKEALVSVKGTEVEQSDERVSSARILTNDDSE